MSELPKRFDPRSIEEPIYRRWMERGYFHVPAERVLEDGQHPYVIVIPPPNVTSVLHMGHGLNNTIQDVLIRWRRMEGRAALWMPGTDHAGIATQNVVERQLAEEGRTRHDLGREAFLEEVWSFVDETGGRILDQLKAIGSSCDWERTRFTLDPGLSRAVREVFVRLYEKGLVYRGEYIINWCPRCLTALSNEEAEGEEAEGRLHHIRYPLPEEAWNAAREAADAGAGAVGRFPDGGWYLTVSTTRPETMLGDTGVAVHPEDERYAPLVGHSVTLPLAGRGIPVVADEYVDRDFGTGMVKVTPAHDLNDFEIARRTGLEVLNILTPKAVTNENVAERFRDRDRFDARKEVLRALREEELLAGDEPHRYSVPRCYRCDTVVEPRLSLQWFVRMAPLAEPALEASRNGTLTFHPARWKKVYEDWLENIRDWCISRQLWWGHRIPVWYCRNEACNEVIAAREDPTECPACGSGDLEQDPDVLDTWFSSWLWPFSVFGWPEETDDLRAFYPGHVLTTAPEILFFWVARMVMSGYEFQGETPFRDVFLHGTVRDRHGRKMSKSLGNGIDPMEVVDRFGADALRYTVLSMCGVGTDIHLDHEDLEAAFAPGRNFANKLWNAGRFTLMSVGDEPVKPLDEVEDDLELADRWILSRLARATGEVTDRLERFRLDEATDRLYHLFWGDFADWYLELVKPRLREEADPASREAARATLVAAFDGILRLLHPLVPFVTEALWEQLPTPRGRERPEALMVAPWPRPEPRWESDEAEEGLAALQEVITSVRSLRKEYGIPEGQTVPIRLGGVPDRLHGTLVREEEAVRRLARVDRMEVDGAGGDGAGARGGESAGAEGAAAPAAAGAGEAERPVGASAVLSRGVELFLPLEGVVDLAKERKRLAEEVERLSDQIQGAEKRLENDQFVSRAPAHVVEKEREKARAFREKREKLQEKLAALGGA